MLLTPAMLLTPELSRESFKVHNESKEAAADYLTNRPIVLKRDKFTCQGCTFRIRPDRNLDRQVPHTSPEFSKYLTLHHKNGDHSNNRPENLVTVCPFCHNVFHAGCASNKSDTKVIFLPWIPQAELNLLVNLLISCQVDQASEYYSSAKLLYEHIDSHFMYADSKKLFEQGMSDAGKLGSSLLSLRHKFPEAYRRRGELLAGLRFFPVEDAYAKAALVWTGEWASQDEWPRLAELWEEANVSRLQCATNQS
jgi:intracellular multiplication protein IcmJ